jgi:hypothetical protein
LLPPSDWIFPAGSAWRCRRTQRPLPIESLVEIMLAYAIFMVGYRLGHVAHARGYTGRQTVPEQAVPHL